jgi:hypothetical protein
LQRSQATVLLLDRTGDAGGRVLCDEVGGDHGRPAGLVGEGAKAILAAGNEHEPRAFAAGEAARSRFADPAEAPVTRAIIAGIVWESANAGARAGASIRVGRSPVPSIASGGPAPATIGS